MRCGCFVLRNAESRSDQINIAINKHIQFTTPKHPNFGNQAINHVTLLARKEEAKAK